MLETVVLGNLLICNDSEASTEHEYAGQVSTPYIGQQRRCMGGWPWEDRHTKPAKGHLADTPPEALSQQKVLLGSHKPQPKTSTKHTYRTAGKKGVVAS